MDFSGRVLDANAEFLSLVGYARDDLVAGRLRWDELTPPEWRGVDEGIMRALVETGEAKPVEKEYFHRSGHRVPVLVGGALLSRETTETVAFVVDLTRQREAESELRVRSELLDQSYDAVLVWGLSEAGAGPIQLWNRGAEALYGYARGEAIGQVSHRLLRTVPAGTTVAEIERTLVASGEWSGELMHTTRDGDVVVVDARLQRLRPASGPPLVLETNRDVTARRRAEAAAAQARGRLAAIVEGSENAIIGETLDGVVTSWNPAAERLFGYSAAEMVGRPIRTIIPPELHAEEAAILARVARGERVAPIETVRVRRDGSRLPVSLTVSPVRDGTGVVVGASKIMRDITGQRVAEAVLAERETRFRHTFEQAAVGMAHVGLDGRWLRLNARLADILGYTREELLAKTFQDVTHPADLDADLAQVRALLAGTAERYAMDKRYVRKDGSLVWVRLTVSLVRDEAGAPDYFISVVEDIDARKRAEAATARYATMLAHITDAVAAFEGEELRIAYLNAEAERLWRRPAAEVLGRPLLEVHPDLAGSLGTHELRQVIAEQRPSQYLDFYPPHGAWYEAQVYPLPPGDGAAGHGSSPAGALTIYRDVSERQRERARAEEARAQAEAANRAKATFIASMSHELRTPLNAIGGYADLLELGLAGPLTDQQRTYVERTRAASRGLLQVVNDVLDLERIEAGKARAARRVSWASEAVAEAIALLQPQAVAKGVALVSACPPDVAYWGDATRVRQIVTNLVANAVKFTPSSGRVTVTCGWSTLGPGEAPPDAASQPAGEDGSRPAGATPGWAVIRVQDTGVGITPEALARVFEAFEQAEVGFNRSHTGTGLGLTISRHLARLMGGDVTAHSVPGEGSTFLVHLPAASAADAQADAPTGTERRSAARYARGLGLIGDAALGEVERILEAYVARLRTDPGTPRAHRQSKAELDDHTATFLADLAQTLALIEAARGGPSEVLRDGTAIQRFVAERHGALRARMGWTADEVRREFGILREEVARAVRRRIEELAAASPDAPERNAPVDEALALLARFAAHAEAASVEGHARAHGGAPAGHDL